MKKYLILFYILILNISNVMAAPIGVESPAIINRQNTDQLKRLQIERDYIKSAPKEIEDGEKTREVKGEIVQGEALYNPEFILNDIVFEGNTVYSDKKLKRFAHPILGRNIQLQDIYNYVGLLTRFYQENGYLTSYAYLEPQDIEDGVIKITIIESRVKGKEIIGNHWGRDAYYKNFVLAGTHLNEGTVFNIKQMQGVIKSLNRESWVQSGVFINKEPDEQDVTIGLDVAERFPVNFDISNDNFGYENSGRNRTSLILGMDNLTGFGDKVFGGTILSSGTKAKLAGYQIPINKYGTKLFYNFSSSTVQPGGVLRDIGLIGRSTIHSIGFSQTIVNTLSTEINSSLSFDFLNSKTDLSAISYTLSDYDLRVLRANINLSHDDRTGRWISSFGSDFGIDGMGATRNRKQGPQSSFYKLSGNLIRVQMLPKNVLAVAKISAQYSPQALYTTEQMYLGGAQTIRGYEPGMLLGDYGVNGSLEFRTPIPGLEKVLPEKLKFVNERVRIAPFYDWGYVKENKGIYGYPKNFIHSVGAALYLYLHDAITVQLGVGLPLGHKCYNENSAKFFFSVNSEFDRLLLKPRKRDKAVY